MKKVFFLIVQLLIVCGSANAQYMLKVQLKDGTHDLFQVDCTEKVSWEKDFLDPDKILMMVDGRKVGFSNTWSLGYYTDMIEEMSIVGTDPVAPATEQSTFELDEETSSVNMVNYSILFGPSVIDGTKTLTVNRVDYAKEPDGLEGGVSYMAAYDFDLEGIHDLDGVVEIRFPANSPCFAAYLNKETGEWEPILHFYDYETREMVIISDHLSTYCIFDVELEHKRRAKLIYWGFDPTQPVEIYKVAQTFAKVAQADNYVYAAIDAYASKEFTIANFGLGVAPDALKLLGCEPKLFNKFCDICGKMGQVWSVVQFANLLRTGETHEITTSALRLIYDLAIKPAMEKKMGGYKCIFTATTTALALLDFELHYFKDEVNNTVTTLYSNAYQQYFRRDSGYPRIGGYGYRSATEWFNLISPLFLDPELSQDEIMSKIDEMVKEYVNQPWRDTDGFNEALSDCRGSWPFWVEIRDKGKKEITDNHRKELYSGTLKSVITNINRKYWFKANEELDKVYEEYAKMMNKTVGLRFKDSALDENGKSKFAGCRVKFSEMPKAILDPEDWECVIKEDGTGLIQFRLYPYCVEGFKPELVVLDENGSVIGNITITEIKDRDKYYESIFDLSDDKVLVLEDIWNIKVDPVLADCETPTPDGGIAKWGPIVYSDSEGIEDKVYGIVPGDFYGIYNGITDAFEDRTLTLDPEGNFSIQNEGLNLTGHFNSRTGYGTGKFTLKASSSGSDYVTEKEAFEDWCRWSLWVIQGKPDTVVYQGGAYTYEATLGNALKHYDANFSVEGTVDIRYSDITECYSFHFDGIGSFNYSGEYYFGPVDAAWWREADGNWRLEIGNRNMTLEGIHIHDGTVIFSPTLIFE